MSPRQTHSSVFTLQNFISSVVNEALQGVEIREATGKDKLDSYVLKLCDPLISDLITYLNVLK